MSHEIEITHEGPPPSPRDSRPPGVSAQLPVRIEDPWGAGGSTTALSAEVQTQPLRKIHRIMRGRYAVAVLLALLFGAVGAWAGWKSQKQTYLAEGLVEIKPTFLDDQYREHQTPMYQNLMESQAALMTTPRVIQVAMDHDDWKSLGRNAEPDALTEYLKSLGVEYLKGTTLIRVTFKDSKPQAANWGVRALLWGYQRTFGEEYTRGLNARVDALQTRQRNLTAAQRAREADLQRLGDRYGTTDLDLFYNTKLQKLAELEYQMSQLSLQFQFAREALNDPNRKETERKPLTNDQIAAVDARMAQMMLDRERSSGEIEVMQLRLGESHRSVIEAKARLALTDKRIADYGDRFRQTKAGVAFQPGGAAQVVTAEQVAQLKAQLEQMLKLVEVERKSTREIGATRQEIAAARLDIQHAVEDVAEAQKSLQQLQAEMNLHARVQVVNDGQAPAQLVRDGRIKMAMVGAMGGMMLPLGLILLIGLADRRMRYSDDAASDEMAGAPMLGILPNLPDRLNDPEQSATAAHCVHQIRTMLQLGSHDPTRSVLAVTSAAPGDGKTSLTLALGLSFAASGSRTLLIDCDMAGGGLTSRLNITAEDGVLEAINTRVLLEHVRGTDVPDLSILPVGQANHLQASSFSPAAIRRMTSEARKHFDVVLIDTGPILGSLEGSPVAAAVDGVILVVARGQQRPTVEKVLALLSSIGAKVAGVVFNRAVGSDFEQSVGGMSARSVRPTSGRATGAARGGDGGVLGPVARAVATSFKANNGHDQ